MAQVTVYVDQGVTYSVVQGTPPVDQSQQVADLTQQLSDMTTARDTLQGKLDRIKTARQAEEAGEHDADTARSTIDAELA